MEVGTLIHFKQLSVGEIFISSDTLKLRSQLQNLLPLFYDHEFAHVRQHKNYFF